MGKMTKWIPGYGGSKGGGSTSKISYRVGTVDNTGQGAHWVHEEFGVNPNQIGHLTPDIVRQAAMDAHVMEQQIAMAKVFVAHSKKIIDGKLEIEKLRAELIEYGLAKKENVDEIVKHVIELAQKHHGHIEKMLKEVEWSKATINAENQSKIGLGQNAFENKLRLILAKHKQGMADQNYAFQQSEKAIAANAQKSRQAKALEEQRKTNFMDYINGKDMSGQRWSTNHQSGFGRSARLSGGRKSAMGQLWS